MYVGRSAPDVPGVSWEVADLDRGRIVPDDRVQALRLTPEDVQREIEAVYAMPVPKGSTRVENDRLFGMFDRVPASELRRLPQSAHD